MDGVSEKGQQIEKAKEIALGLTRVVSELDSGQPPETATLQALTQLKMEAQTCGLDVVLGILLTMSIGEREIIDNVVQTAKTMITVPQKKPGGGTVPVNEVVTNGLGAVSYVIEDKLGYHDTGKAGNLASCYMAMGCVTSWMAEGLALQAQGQTRE